MRRTNLSYVSLRNSSSAETYAVTTSTVKEIRALLKRDHAKKTEGEAFEGYLSAEAIFPELDDGIMGPANYLKGIRLREKMTQSELAKKTKMLQHHISEMENGKRIITNAAAKKLAEVLNTDWRRMI